MDYRKYEVWAALTGRVPKCFLCQRQLEPTKTCAYVSMSDMVFIACTQCAHMRPLSVHDTRLQQAIEIFHADNMTGIRLADGRIFYTERSVWRF